MFGGCADTIAILTKAKNIPWVICEDCQAWYHSCCVGLSERVTANREFKFTCCVQTPNDEMYV